MLNITKEKLKSLIVSAYESGWSGCLELKSEYAEQVVEQLGSMDYSYSTMTVSTPIAQSTSTTIVSDSVTNFMPGYYSYFGSASPSETLFVNEPGEEAL